jgi:hypothetical protein
MKDVLPFALLSYLEDIDVALAVNLVRALSLKRRICDTVDAHANGSP